MRKMIYLCPVDWRWLKQRPQFLAEELGRHYNVQVLYPWRNNRKGLQKKQTSAVSRHPFFSIPSLGGRIPGVRRINRLLHKFQFHIRFCIVQPDFIWLTHPDQLCMLPRGYTGLVLYDCMDDYEAIEMNPNRQTEIQELEFRLVQRADVVFASSRTILLRLLKEHQANPDKVFLMRNGYDAQWKPAAQTLPDASEKMRIGYFGTIGRWFDFNVLQTSLEQFTDIEYHLFGAFEKGVSIPRCDRIVYHGVIEHARLPEFAGALDVLIMPFQLTKVVKSVDPVKLYEYIFLKKPILCIRYEEIERFEPFVFFYQTEEECMDQIERLRHGGRRPYSDEQAQAFLDANSWSCRADRIYRILEECAETQGKPECESLDTRSDQRG